MSQPPRGRSTPAGLVEDVLGGLGRIHLHRNAGYIASCSGCPEDPYRPVTAGFMPVTLLGR